MATSRREPIGNDIVRPGGRSLSAHLRIAVLTGVQAAVRVRIARGDDVNATDDRGRSPLMLAASRGHLETCRLLLDAGAALESLDYDGNTALFLAEEKGHAPVVALLHSRLPTGAETGGETDPEGLRDSSNSPYELPASSQAETPDSIALDDDWEEWQLLDWEPEPEPVPPLSDPEVIIRAEVLSQSIASHVPIDLDEDWSDIEIDLPDSDHYRRLRLVMDDDLEAAVRALFQDGLGDGHWFSLIHACKTLKYMIKILFSTNLWTSFECEATP